MKINEFVVILLGLVLYGGVMGFVIWTAEDKRHRVIIIGSLLGIWFAHLVAIAGRSRASWPYYKGFLLGLFYWGHVGC